MFLANVLNSLPPGPSPPFLTHPQVPAAINWWSLGALGDSVQTRSQVAPWDSQQSV